MRAVLRSCGISARVIKWLVDVAVGTATSWRRLTPAKDVLSAGAGQVNRASVETDGVRIIRATRPPYRALGLALALLFLPTSGRAETESERTCKLVEHEVRDCGCATAFLAGHPGDKNASIILSVWALATGAIPPSVTAALAVQEKYGAEAILAASIAFQRIRPLFQVTCKPSDYLTDEDW